MEAIGIAKIGFAGVGIKRPDVLNPETKIVLDLFVEAFPCVIGGKNLNAKKRSFANNAVDLVTGAENHYVRDAEVGWGDLKPKFGKSLDTPFCSMTSKDKKNFAL